MTAQNLAIIVLILAVFRLLIYLFPGISFINAKFKKSALDYIDSIIVAGIVALFIIQFLFRTFYIPSGSMLPTLQLKDYILVDKITFYLREPRRCDIVVFEPPPEAGFKDKELIKRIIGMPGETLAVHEGKVFINGKPLEEPYIFYKPDYELPETRIPQGSYFMMGDNRSSSADSHIWGFLPRKNMIGKAEVVIFPPNRIGILK